MDLLKKYNDELNRIKRNRATDWSTYNIEFRVAGELLVPMSVQTWFDLMLVNSPIINNPEETTIDSILDYVWRNSARFTKNKLLKEWRLFWLYRRIKRDLLNPSTAYALIQVLQFHITMSFEELPEHKPGNDEGSKSMMHITSEGALIDEIASRYMMKPGEVLEMPLRQAFALLRIIRLRTIPDYELLDPLALRKIKQEYLNSLNNG